MLEPQSLQSMVSAIGRFTDHAIAALQRVKRTVHHDSQPTQQPIKEWYGVVTSSSNGVWTADYSDAGFSEILHIHPQAVLNSSSANDQVIATLTSYSLTTASGMTVRGGISVIGGTGLREQGGATVLVKVIGH